MGERLDSMEKNYVKGLPKTNDVSKVKNSANKVKYAKAQAKQHRSDVNASPASVPMHTIPPLDRLCEEARIQAEVQNCQVSKGGGRGSVDVFVSNRVKWPHEFVLSGQNKDRVSYNQLSPIQ